ncbi:cysteine desulfurase family protein [Patescibacteria group bacterium]
MKNIYLDYASTTPVHPQVLKEMLPYFSEKFGNPSSIHSFGREAKKAISDAREKVSGLLNCAMQEVFFTGTTTTSDSLAILGTVGAHKNKGHIITSAIEHHAVLDTFKELEKEGHKITILPVDKHGIVRLEDVEKAITKDTFLISIMYANNEVGTIQPVKEIADIAHKHNVIVHTDAAACADYLDLDTKKLGVDLLTLGSHKFGGPKGVGILYVKKGTPIKPITFGGHHESGLWPGTESVPLIIGTAKALEIATNERKEAVKRVSELKDKLIKGVLETVPNSKLTGHPTQRLPDIASFVIKGAEGEAMLLALSDKGVAASSGSACTSGTLKPSHVLTSMGIPPEIAHGSLRFSLGKNTTEDEIEYVIEILPEIVEKLRKMAPNLKEFTK